ncbi:MAG: Transketolase [Alphaproteobacteria bacterium MarineAlpha6_Bin4]|nr:MAG: Transketolase [Alphaproteobacteria bacterium MarineAlpha6_Bin3]PPR38031.1 MAG: Transketolase [Alphaproteobacteria bacterium MarineAlpha6_Bin4]
MLTKNYLNIKELKLMSNAIRALSMDAVEKANSGHPGMPLGMSDVITILYKYFLNFNPKNPEWINRDRFILSAGHGSMLLYSVLHLTGYKNMTINQIKKFRQLNSKTAGHPEYDVKSGIETTTGPLGQGLGNSVGMAIAEKHLSSIFGKNIINHNTFVVAGDGCLMEGISQEAISLAGHLKLNKLIVLFDDNNVSIDGPTNLSTSENHLLRFKACNWDVQKINGHNFKQIYDAINKAKKTNKPSLIACKTIIGYGSPNKQGKNSSHGAALGLDEVKKTKNKINWEHPPFIIPNEILKIWRKTRLKGILENKKWDKKLKSLNKKKKSLFGNYFEKKINNKCFSELKKIKTKIHLSNDSVATRKASNIAINSLLKEIPFLLGGSADLTESNLTKGDNQKIFSSTNNKGTYIYYGIREHAMAAAMTGISLHGGLIPYGGSFLIFTDYCKPSIRLASIMKQKVVYVMTHDSIGLGEDGPTHQPIEQLTSLRSLPNLNVLRPADAIETLECWEIALRENSPSVLSLTRQNVPLVRKLNLSANMSKKGAYIISETKKNKRDITIISTGSEVSIAIEAKKILEKKSLNVTVVSMPCWEIFDKTSDTYKNKILGPIKKRIAIEAALKYGWTKYILNEEHMLGMSSFGASAPAEILYNNFGLNAKELVKLALRIYKKSNG